MMPGINEEVLIEEGHTMYLDLEQCSGKCKSDYDHSGTPSNMLDESKTHFKLEMKVTVDKHYGSV